MKILFWKLRYTFRFWRLTRMPLRYAWDNAGAWMEMLNGDTSESVNECVDEEIEESMRG